MPQIRSAQPELLSDTANFIAEDICAVLINDEIRITDFSLKQAEDNIVTIQYEVFSSQTNLVNNVKLLGPNDKVLTEASVYVPVTQTIVSKHLITVKEGV